MFKNRLGSFFMIYYFNAIKSLVDTKEELTYFLSGAGYLRGHHGPAFPSRRSKKAFWFCWQSLWREIMEKIKTPIIIFSPSFPGKALPPWQIVW